MSKMDFSILKLKKKRAKMACDLYVGKKQNIFKNIM